MKNIIRAFALALVVTGAVASSHASFGTTEASISPRTNALPVPTCPPDDPKGCGVCQYNGNCK